MTMRIFHSLAEVPPDFGPSVVAIGNFDGVHRGHQWIIEQVRARAQALSASSIAVIFDPHPARVLRPKQSPRLITPMAARLDLLAATGLDATLVLPFTEEFSRLSAYDFASGLLRRELRAVEVHEGDNFRFGYQAQAGMPELIELGRALGFSVVVHPVRMVRGMPVSSSQVRERIAAGDMAGARALLGRVFSVHSTPTKGRGIGTKLTVPTVNLAPYSELLPVNGVYVTQLKMGGECFDSVTNAGNRPTFGEDSFAVESHMLNFRPVDLRSETPLELAFLQRIRAERRFDSPDALKAQILRDVSYAQRYFRLLKRP